MVVTPRDIRPSAAPLTAFMVLIPLFAVVLAALAPGLGVLAYVLIAALLAIMAGLGWPCRKLMPQGCDPFLALVFGYVVVSHAMLLTNMVWPGVHWQVAVVLGLVGILGWKGGATPNGARLSLSQTAGLGLLITAFVFVWAADIAPRLDEYVRTGKLPFWIDMFVHAGNIAHFASDDVSRRGMMLMADVGQPIYHYASYLPVALLAKMAGVPFLDATLLVWLPLGVLVMASGVASLGMALGGPRFAALVVCGLAAISVSLLDILRNGFLGLSWLLETAPGTAYSLGVACAALAAVVHWMRSRRTGALIAAGVLTAGCFLLRLNTFVWLAPTIVLSIVATWPGVSAPRRVALVMLGLAGLVVLFVGLSLPRLRDAPLEFLSGYVEWVHQANHPTSYDGLYEAVVRGLGRWGAVPIGVALTMLGIVGIWLPAFIILGTIAKWRGRLEGIDMIPLILVAVAALAMVLGPPGRNGDVSEFRHRPGPLLAVVGMVWTMRFGALVFAERVKGRAGWRAPAAIGLVAALAIAAQTTTIGAAKRPNFEWASAYFGLQTPRELLAIAPYLSDPANGRPRFAVANQPHEAHVEDDASRLVALSGMPAYIACPSFLLAVGGSISEEARRRLAVIEKLDRSPDVAELRRTMRIEGITHYVVTKPTDASFDPDRREALGRSGSYAVYSVNPAGS